MHPDPIIDQIREVRHRISEQFDHDPKRLVEHYMQLQERDRGRLVSPPVKEPTTPREEP